MEISKDINMSIKIIDFFLFDYYHPFHATGVKKELFKFAYGASPC
jgi:hypothetical protein